MPVSRRAADAAAAGDDVADTKRGNKEGAGNPDDGWKYHIFEPLGRGLLLNYKKISVQNLSKIKQNLA
jgi:hypothetical protein